MIDLERALTDLAEHLDVPTSSGAAERLRLRLAESGPARRSHRYARALLVAAALTAFVSAGVLAIAPARHAVAGWLGIGAVEIRRSQGPVLPAPSTTTTPTSSTRPPAAETELAAAQKAVQFEIATAHDASAGSPTHVTVDRRVPGGLVTLSYERFTLVEIATNKTQPPLLAKLVGDAPVEPVTVHGRDGLWIPVPHHLAYIDRNGKYETDTIRQSGPVLLWERDGVTYRVEGPRTLAKAQTIADSIG